MSECFDGFCVCIGADRTSEGSNTITATSRFGGDLAGIVMGAAIDHITKRQGIIIMHHQREDDNNTTGDEHFVCIDT